MEEVLLNIGSIIRVESTNYMIVGKRVIDFKDIKAWDYCAVPYPEGLQNKSNVESNGIYFNHLDIKEIVHKCEVMLPNESNKSSTDLFKNRRD